MLLDKYHDWKKCILEVHGIERKDDFVAVFVTVPSEEEAEILAQGILGKRLAACANIIPGVKSLFWWEGKIDRAEEGMMIIKTRRELCDGLTKYIIANHRYKVPEVVVLPITGGNADYLGWIKESTVELEE